MSEAGRRPGWRLRRRNPAHPRSAPALAAGRIDAGLALRVAGTGDHDTLFAWYRQALRAPIAALQGWDEAVRWADFQRLLALVPTFVVVADRQDAGFIQVWPRAELLHLVNIAITWDARGRGVGSRVLAWLQRRAAATGRGMHLKVLRTNPGVLDFYRRAGFTVERRSHEYWWLDWPG